MALATGTSIWYPPAALTYSLLAILGVAWAWLPTIASLIAGAELWHGFPTIFELAGSLSHVASYAVAAALFRRLTAPPRSRLTSQKLSVFVLAGLVGAAITAVLGTINQELAGLASSDIASAA